MGEVGTWIIITVGIIQGLMGLSWRTMESRVSKSEDALHNKADKSEMDRQRDNIAELFASTRTIEISAATIREQIARVAADMESEKRTRAESNRAVNDKLDRIFDRLSNNGNGKTL